MLHRCVTALNLPSAFRGQRAPQLQQRRCSVKVSAAWNPFMPDYSNGQHQQPESEERFGSLFASSWVPPSNNPATVWDARDAMEACGGLWGDERQECLDVFGLDAGQVDTFYTTVYSLEQALNQDTDPEEEASHRGQERC